MIAGEYQTLRNQGIETNILFFGQEQCKPNHLYKGNNVRDQYILHYVQTGKGVFSIANHHTVTLKAGDIFILPKGIPCFYQATSTDPWAYYWIGFSGVKTRSLFENSGIFSRGYLKQIQDSQTYSSLNELFLTLHHSSSLTNDLLIESLIYKFFYYLLTEYPSSSSKSNDSTQILKLATDYLESNYANSSCSIITLCHKLDISRSYLYNIFKKNLGLPPQKYLMTFRMEKAKEKLMQTDNSIQLISDQVGYSDEFTFSKAFKRYCGFSPKSYRQINYKK